MGYFTKASKDIWNNLLRFQPLIGTWQINNQLPAFNYISKRRTYHVLRIDRLRDELWSARRFYSWRYTTKHTRPVRDQKCEKNIREQFHAHHRCTVSRVGKVQLADCRNERYTADASESQSDRAITIIVRSQRRLLVWIAQALLGEIGMDSVLESMSMSLYNGRIPDVWTKLAPQTNKNLGAWTGHFVRRTKQYEQWVRTDSIVCY